MNVPRNELKQRNSQQESLGLELCHELGAFSELPASPSRALLRDVSDSSQRLPALTALWKRKVMD